MTFEYYQDKGGGWRWRLVAGNGKTVGDSSEDYTDKHGAKRAAEMVRAGIGPSTPIVEAP